MIRIARKPVTYYLGSNYIRTCIWRLNSGDDCFATIVDIVGKSFICGFHFQEVILDRYAMENELDQGNVMIIVLEGSPNYSTAHFLVLTGYDVQGFFVNDPVSPANSRVRWAYEDLEEYIVAIWSLSKE